LKHRHIIFVLLTVVLCLLAAAPPATAVLQEITYRGTVTALSQANNTVTINVTHQYGCVFGNNTTRCTWDPIAPQVLNGTTPVPDLFSTVKVGSMVEATSIGGPGGRWIAIGTLFPTPGIENWFATDVFGDPDAAPAPLMANYGLIYTAKPDCAKCNGAVCNASSVNITITRVNADVFDKVLRPGENFEYFDQKDNSSVWVKFVSGEAPSSLCPNATVMTGIQPISVFVVHVSQPVVNATTPATTGPVNTTRTANTTSPVTTTAAGFAPFTALGALGILGAAALLGRKVQ
jgi:hypothetical protein